MVSRAWRLALLLLLSCCGCSWDWDKYADHRSGNSSTCATGVPDERMARLSRGIDLYGWLELENGPAPFDEFISDTDLQRFAQAGVTFVRASFYSPVLFDPANPDTLTQANLQYFERAAARARAAGLGIVFVPYFETTFKQQLSDPATQAAALGSLLRMWTRFAEFLATTDPNWVFPELMGAPDFADSHAWNTILLPLAAAVRGVLPSHTLIADGNSGSLRVDWNSITALSELATIPGEKNVVYGFIFFDPVIFTHQGADWRPEWPELASARNLPYPSSPDLVETALSAITDTAARAEVESYGRESWGHELLSIGLDKVAQWSASNCARVMCVEFGVYRQYSPVDSAARWVGDTRSLLQERHIAWSYWSYKERFGIQPQQPGPVIEPVMAEALGLAQ